MQMLIYQKDSTQDMSEINTASIELVLTSPPYWNIIDYKHNKQLGQGLTYNHYIFMLKKTLLECMRVLKEDAFAVFIVGDIRKSAKYLGKEERPKIFSLHSDIIQYFIEMGFEFHSHIIWKKTSVKKGEKGKILYCPVGKGKYKNYGTGPFVYTDLSIEHILIFRKPGKLRKLSLDERLSDEYNRIPKRDLEKWVDPVWFIDSQLNNQHPATFPAELACRLIKMYSLRNDTVLDPFCGIGTTLDVSFSLERNSIGYEINEKYITELSEYYNLNKDGNKYYAVYPPSVNDNQAVVDGETQ